MEFRLIAFLILAGLIVLDAIITYHTFRKTEIELDILRAKIGMIDTHTNSLNQAWLGVEEDLKKIREEIRTNSGHINSRFKSLEKKNTPIADNKHDNKKS